MSNLVGQIISVRGLIVTIKCLGKSPAIRSILNIEEDQTVKLVVLNQGTENTVQVLNLAQDSNIILGQSVVLNQSSLEIPVGINTLGRIFNALGETIDAKEEISDVQKVPVESVLANEHYEGETNNSIIETGIKVIDFFTPFVRGRKIGIIGGAGVGKTVLVTEIMHNVCRNDKGITFFVGIGERIREAHELYETLKAQSLLGNTVMYLGQMNETAAMRSLSGISAAAAARWWRDVHKKDVLFFVDNIYRYLQAQNELSTMLGQPSSEGGYQPALFSDLARFQEGLGSNSNGSITSVQSIFVPADDTSDPAVVEIYEQLDSVIVLSRDIMESGILPAVDLIESNSSLLSVDFIGERHALLVSRVQKILEKYNHLQGIITIIGETELSLEDRADYQKAKQLIEFFTQPLFVTEALTGVNGQYVSRDNTLAGVEEILTGN